MTRSSLHSAILSVGLALSAAIAEPALADSGLRRFALVIGANDGGPERSTLRYAETDARTVAGVMTELGGVAPSDRVLVVDPDKASLIVALGELRRRIEAVDDQRTEVIVYYSGHSDERGLLLRTQRFTYKELREALENLDSDVRIAILDSCASGAMVTGKGGRHVAGFLANEANQVAGHAYLTSSAADEMSQEAASLGGSYFTHSLVTGLRGAADVNTDQLVTLNEAYRFAFEETLARTESSRFGAQHANFDIQLSGSGDLVMTDLRERTATLNLDEAMAGRVYVRDSDGRLVAELGKTPGREVSLLLEPGRYSVKLEKDDQVYGGIAKVDGASPAQVSFSDLTPTAVVATVARGDTGEGSLADTITRVVDGALSTTDSVHIDLIIRDDSIQGTAIALGLTHYSGDVAGAQVAMGANSVGQHLEGAQVAIGGNTVGGAATGFQGSAGINVAGESKGLAQLTSGINILKQGGRGTQFSTGANIVGGDFDGVQLTTGTNITGGDHAGAQVSLGTNIAGGALQGAQVTLGANIAHGLAGYQGALLNIAGNGRGTQTGVMNIAGDFDGAMVGVVNIAKSTDAPVGIINIIGDGIHAIEVGTLNGLLAGTLKLGGRNVYTSYSGVYGPDQADAMGQWQVGMAIGGRTEQGFLQSDLDVGADLMGNNMFQSTDELGTQILAPRIRLALAFPLLDGRISPYAAGRISMGIAIDGNRVLPEHLNKWEVNEQIGLWPSGELGVRMSL